MKLKRLRNILVILLVLNIGTCAGTGIDWDAPMSIMGFFQFILGIALFFSLIIVSSKLEDTNEELDVDISEPAIEEEHEKTTVCRRCKRTRRCNFFPLVIAHVIDQKSWETPIGGTGYKINTETMYKKIGSSGAYFCKPCQIYNWIKRMRFSFFMGIAPLIVIVMIFIFPELNDFVKNYFDPFWLRMTAILVLVFGGIMVVPFFFLYLIGFKGGSYEAAEELCKDGIKKKYRVGFVGTEQIYTGGVGTGDIKLYRKSTFDNLSQQR